MPRPPVIRSNGFNSSRPFITIDRFISYLNLKRCTSCIDSMKSRVVLLYLGEPIVLPYLSKVKSLQELSYKQCRSKEKQFIFNHKNQYPNLYLLIRREQRLLKRKLHKEFFHFDEIAEMQFVKDLCFPKF